MLKGGHSPYPVLKFWVWRALVDSSRVLAGGLPGGRSGGGIDASSPIPWSRMTEFVGRASTAARVIFRFIVTPISGLYDGCLDTNQIRWHEWTRQDTSGGIEEISGLFGFCLFGSCHKIGFGYRRSWVRVPPPRPLMLESVPMRARIYLPPKSAMQSGRAGSEWVLAYESDAPERADRLMGWIGGGDTQTQGRLHFPH